MDIQRLSAILALASKLAESVNSSDLQKCKSCLCKGIDGYCDVPKDYCSAMDIIVSLTKNSA